MAQRDLTKDDRVLYIDPVPVPGSGAYSKVICLTSVGGKRTTATNSTQTFCGTKVNLGANSITYDIAGTCVLNPDGVAPDAQMSVNDLIQLWKDQARFKCKYGAIVPSEGDIVETFEASLTEVDDTNTPDNGPTFTATLTVYYDTYETETVSPTT